MRRGQQRTHKSAGQGLVAPDQRCVDGESACRRGTVHLDENRALTWGFARVRSVSPQPVLSPAVLSCAGFPTTSQGAADADGHCCETPGPGWRPPAPSRAHRGAHGGELDGQLAPVTQCSSPSPTASCFGTRVATSAVGCGRRRRPVPRLYKRECGRHDGRSAHRRRARARHAQLGRLVEPRPAPRRAPARVDPEGFLGSLRSEEVDGATDEGAEADRGKHGPLSGEDQVKREGADR